MKPTKRLITNKLLELEGFTWEDFSVEGYECNYEKIIPHGDDLYELFVAIDLENRRVYFYDQYECGGVIGSYDLDIPEYLDLWSTQFIDWLNSEMEDYL